VIFMMTNRLTDKQKKLITDNYRLLDGFIEYTINKRVIPKCLEDDFVSDMYLKFCFSALKYNIDTGFKFSTYAYGGFNLGIKDIITRKKKSFDRIRYIGEIDEGDLREYRLEREFNLRSDIIDNFLSDAHLTSRERSMLEDYYYGEISFARLGKKYNLSKECARLAVKRVLRKLKKTTIKMDLEMEDFYK